MKILYLSFLIILAFIINTNAINAPSITSPSNGATNQDLTLYIDWTDIAGNEGYVYQLDTVSDFNSAFFIQDTTGTDVSFKHLSDLFFGTTYYWRVMTLNSGGNSAWSPAWNFTTKSTVNITAPTNGSSNQNIELYLDWTDITENTGYMYQIDTCSTFNSPLFVQGTTPTDNSHVSQSDLLFGTTYYWRACAKSVNDTSAWSSTWNFTTANTVITTSPNNGAINQDTSLYLDWSDITGNNGYMYQIDTSGSFNTSLLQEGATTQNNSYVGISDLLYGTTYYWRACAKSNIDTSDWSDISHFRTSYQLTNAPNLVSPADGSIGIDYNAVDLEWSSIPQATTYQYQYSIDNSFSSNVFNGTTTYLTKTINNLNQNTSYYWRVRGQNSSGYSPWSDIWEFTTDNTTDISEVLEINCIQVFPNPVFNILTITGDDIISIKLINSNGQLVESKTVNTIITSFNLNKLTEGIYFVEIITNNNIVYKKIIKE